jgi:cell division protein FtsB
MSRRPDPALDDAQEPDARASGDADAERAAPDLAALPVVGITRRRIAILASTMLAAWIVIAFARQVGEVSAASTRADDIATANANLHIEVAALERELDLIARQRYIEQQARAYGLGGRNEIPFALAAGAPVLPDDAPGSAALRVGAQTDSVAPLERWLTVLFGPSD